jgi:hypothetical protein
MAFHIGAQKGQIAGTVLLMVEVCATCPDRGSCALLLQKGRLKTSRDAQFCPNHPSFAAHWAEA